MFATKICSVELCAAEAVHSPSSFPPVQIVLNLSIMELAIDSGALPLALRVGSPVEEAKLAALILSRACRAPELQC